MPLTLISVTSDSWSKVATSVRQNGSTYDSDSGTSTASDTTHDTSGWQTGSTENANATGPGAAAAAEVTAGAWLGKNSIASGIVGVKSNSQLDVAVVSPESGRSAASAVETHSSQECTFSCDNSGTLVHLLNIKCSAIASANISSGSVICATCDAGELKATKKAAGGWDVEKTGTSLYNVSSLNESLSISEGVTASERVNFSAEVDVQTVEISTDDGLVSSAVDLEATVMGYLA